MRTMAFKRGDFATALFFGRSQEIEMSASGVGYGSLSHTVTIEEEIPAGKKNETSAEGSGIVFYDVSYEVGVRCGTKKKVILQPCRFLVFSTSCIFFFASSLNVHV